MNTMAVYVSFLCIAALSTVRAADYTGTFKSERLSMTLTETQGRYIGKIGMGGREYPCTARETEGRLAGTFTCGDNEFGFTVILENDTATLESGGSTYTLARQSPSANPLARPKPISRPQVSDQRAASAAVESPAPAKTKSRNVVRLKRMSVVDQPNMIGGEAFSFLAPSDWVIEGGLVWRLHPTMPAAVAMRVRAPNGLEQLEVFPTVAFSWGGYLGPGTMFPPGANYLGNEVQPPVQDAVSYIKDRHLPRTRGNVQPRMVKSEALPKLAEAARQAEPTPPFGGPEVLFTAGRVRVEYEMNGCILEEDLYCVLNTVKLPPGNMTIQIADKLYGLRAPKGQLDETTRFFETMIHSTRVNLEWFNKYAQLVQALTQAQMNRIRAAGELSRYISQTSSEISDMMRQSYEQRQASQDRINKNWSQYMHGVEEYHDPMAGRPVELPTGYRNAWVGQSGEYIVSDSADFNPNVELGGNWQRLERKER